jgi:hypothetical protein
MSGRLKVKLLVTLPVGHDGRALDAGPPPPRDQPRQISVMPGELAPMEPTRFQ